MELSRQSCRICLSDTEFNVSLFSNYSRRTNLVEKILFCLKIVIDKMDIYNTICYKCTENIERYYDFILLVKKCQSRLDSEKYNERSKNVKTSPSVGRRHNISYVREEFDTSYTFSFLEMPANEEKKENKTSSPFFSYFSPPNILVNQSASEPAWKTPRPRNDDLPKHDKRDRKRAGQPTEPARRHSRDLFDSQSQDADEAEPSALGAALTPDDNIMKRLREKFFGRCDF